MVRGPNASKRLPPSPKMSLFAAKCIDEYIRLRVQADGSSIDERLVSVVERMFARCFEDKQLKQALGIALETHRLDKVREVISKSDDIEEMLRHCFQLSLTVIKNRDFRQQVWRLFAYHYRLIYCWTDYA